MSMQRHRTCPQGIITPLSYKEATFTFSPSIFSVPIGTDDAQVPYINTDIWLHPSQRLLSLSYIWRFTKTQTELARPSLSSYTAQPALGYFPSSPVAPRE